MNITGGKYNSRYIKAPDSDKVRPTLSKIRESVFNILQAKINFEEAVFLDAFSGSGIMSLEAISRGFKSVISIEKDFKTAKFIKENFKQLELEPNLIIGDTTKILDKLIEQFDVIYLDPPYKDVELYNKTLNKIVEKNLLKNDGFIIVESQKGVEYTIPQELSLIKEKTYGDTNIIFFTNK